MFESDVIDIVQASSTGTLPEAVVVADLVRQAHERYAGLDDGAVADYIPILVAADPSAFGLALTGIDGGSVHAGDVDIAFSIQSISKAFVFALLCDDLGHRAVHDAVGVNNTGLAFNSVMAIELNGGSPMNPMVNAGAIATTALVPGRDAEEQWQRVRRGLSAFAGRPLMLDGQVYESESFTNFRNQALARLLQSYGGLAVSPEDAVDVYTRQCSLSTTAADLAVMGA